MNVDLRLGDLWRELDEWPELADRLPGARPAGGRVSVREPWFPALRLWWVGRLLVLAKTLQREALALDASANQHLDRVEAGHSRPIGNSGNIALHDDGLVADAFREAANSQPRCDK